MIFCYGVCIVVCTIILGKDVRGYAPLLVAVLLSGSVQLMSIGLLGEYTERIYVQVKRRPTYLVHRQHNITVEVRSK